MKIKIFEKTFFGAVLLLLSPLVGAAGVTLIILDTTPPVVMITNPVNNTVINIFNNTISGVVSDNIGISQVNLSLNGSVLYTWNSTGSFNKKVNYTANTTAVITITASDTSNNTVSETIMVDILPNTVSRTVTTIANVVETVDAKNETNTIINFTTVQDVTGSINVTAGTSASAVGAVPMTSAYGLAQDQQSIDKYLEINVSDSINATSGSVSWAIIAMYYSDADLDKNGNGNASDPDDINESSLKFWWYCSNCPSESKWRVLETGNDYTSLGGPYVYEASVDIPNNYVWANISQFSLYGIVGTIISATPAQPLSPALPGGGGGVGAAAPACIKEGFQSLGIDLMSCIIRELGLEYKIFYRVANTLASIFSMVSDVIGEYPAPQLNVSAHIAKPITPLEGDVYEIAVEKVKQRGTFTTIVVVARGDLEVDSYAAVAYAKSGRYPILLTKPDELPSVTLEEIQRLTPRKIIIAGGPVAVSKAVENELAVIAPVERIWGMNREETAVELAKAMEEKTTITTLVVADGLNVSSEATIIAAGYKAPIVYVSRDEISTVTRDFLVDHKRTKDAYKRPMKVVFVGVSKDLQKEIEALMSVS